jgi:hypothetical protein
MLRRKSEYSFILPVEDDITKCLSYEEMNEEYAVKKCRKKLVT